MSWIQSGKNRHPEKPVSGCLGRMVNMFDLTNGTGGKKLLTDKPHNDGSSFSGRHSDASRTSLVDDDEMDDNVIVKSPSSRKSNGTPIKMLIAHEMSKEEDSKQSPSNLVAKLMGLEAIPQQHQPGSRRSQSGSLEFLQQEHEISRYQEHGEYKDVFECVRDDSPQKGRCNEKQKMALVREKFMEAKRLSTDEKHRQSKQFQDALEVLSSHKDLFLKFLQEPNSLFSQHIYDSESLPPPPDSRRITVLKPSKLVDKKNEKQVKETVQKAWDKSSSDFILSPECCKTDGDVNPPTRIVVLKPSSVKPYNIKVASSPLSSSHDDVFDRDPEEVLEEIENEMSDSGLRRDETLLSSVFSNGYIGDDSSYCKSEIDYAAGNLSDSEVVSPVSRHSWDYINRFNSHYTASSSRTSYSRESSVCREAKKRLSERWANTNKVVQEQRQIQRSSSTLGDMLALSDVKQPVKTEENNEIKEDADQNLGNLLRSKSVPASATPLEVSGSLKGKEDETTDVGKEKLVKSLSFKGRVSSLFFSKSKKSSKEKSHQSKDAPQSSRNAGNEGSQCVNDTRVEDESCSGLKHRINLPEAGFPFTKSEIRENQDEPSPISVLEPPFEEDDRTTDCLRSSKLIAHGIEPMRYNLIDKSPPIGSIARTLSWDDSVGSSTPYVGKPSSAPLNPEEEEQECLFHVQTLLSVSGFNKVRSSSFLNKWHSPESPLDPSLRDKYMNLSEKEPILIQPKRRHHTSIAKLVFDCVNEALIDIANRGPCSWAHGSLDDMTTSSTVLTNRVWAHVKEWISGEERCEWDDGDGGSLVVERVVSKEVVGRGWLEGLRLEIDNTRKEIEGKLLDELVQESVLELTGRA
ncbi:hypothetical protein CTI12_AA090900 [Artemisia annua]|uniref:DUF3741-associated sequence motif protein n=1 Tax=Artemisia annua TaxID=35608 RepID=A0A2U1PRQ9_ARTAN|nr:hypothetical protein CTI12_AA090900 [Artemisia annua]